MAPFTRTLKRTLPVYLSFIFAAVAASSVLLAQHYHGRVRKAEAALSKEQGRNAAQRVVKVSQQEKTYLKALSERYGFDSKENDYLRDAISLAAQMNQDLNRSVPAEYSTEKTPWLPPPPRTLSNRDLTATHRAAFSIEGGIIEAADQPELYQYSISNPTSTAVPMPILHSGVRWDDAEMMAETAGLRGIADEIDRAIAIWRFVSERRYHAKPVTEGAEEHDTVRFFSCYGYGFCDDASQAVAGLAKLCGLQARIWGLEGHVVPEIFAGGRWLLLDADFAAYFHKPGDPRAILGVEELAKDRAAFKNVFQLGKLSGYEGSYADFFLTTNDNKPWPVEARSEHRIAATLAPGEKVVFSNFNWGSYFIGAYPQRVPRYFNGYFERPIMADSLKLSDGLEVRREGESFTIANSARREKRAEIFGEAPFPIVGGMVISPVSVKLEFEDTVTGRKMRLNEGREVSFTGAVTRVGKQPTTSYVLGIVIPPGGMVKFDKPLRLITDFQFAELPLLRIKKGANSFRAFSSTPATLAGLKGDIWWR